MTFLKRMRNFMGPSLDDQPKVLHQIEALSFRIARIWVPLARMSLSRPYDSMKQSALVRVICDAPNSGMSVLLKGAMPFRGLEM